MKKTALLVSVCFTLTPVFAQLTGNQSNYEPFSDSTGAGGTAYTVGQPLAPNSPALSDSTLASETVGGSVGVGIPSWWSVTNTSSGGTSSASPLPTVVTGDLSFNGLLSTGGGRSAQFNGTGTSALMNLTTDSGAGGYTSGTVYYSFALRLADISSLPTDQSAADLLVGLTKVESYKANTTTPTSVGAQLWIRSNGGTGYQLGIEAGANANNNSASPTYSTVNSYSTSDTLFIVGEYDFSSKTASLFINPTPGGSQPAADATDTQSGTGVARAASFTIFGDNPTLGSGDVPITGQIDDLRFGLTWDAVTPTVPEPTTVALGGIGLLVIFVRRYLRR